MSAFGWLKLHRKLIDWEWFTDEKTLQLFIYLLCTANTEEKAFKGVKIGVGQRVIGRKQLAETLNKSEREIRTALEHLKSTNEITIKTTNRFSIVTICNYAKYQGCNFDDSPSNDQQKTTTIEYKNIEYNNNTTSTTAPPSMKIDIRPIGEYMSIIVKEQAWVESVCMNHKIHPIDFLKNVEQFLTECKSNGNDTAQNEKDAKAHFNAWLRIKINAEQQKKKQYGNNGTTENPTDRLKRLLELGDD